MTKFDCAVYPNFKLLCVYALLFTIILIFMISSLRKLTTVALNLQLRPVYRFADNWKDRDEASEKVYISQAESNSS